MKTSLALALFLAATAHAQTSGGIIARQAPVVPGLPPSAVRACTVADLSLATDDEHGNFNGMNQSGTLLILRNLSPNACSVPAIPQLTFSSKSGPLHATLHTPGFGTQPNGMRLGHGPVVPPVVIAPGAEVTSTLHWVAGEVYDKNVCIQPTALILTIGGKQQTTAFDAHLCGDSNAGGVTYDATRFAPDPVYRPAN